MDDIKKHQPPLQKLNKVIDWEIFRPILESELLNKSKVKGGRPPFDKLLMFKIIILQRYFNISDDQTEFQIKDRLSFMDFLNLELSDKIPDAKTIWFFKDQLCKKGLTEKLFDLFTVTLNSKGIIAKEGSMVDASFVDVPKQRNNREDNAIIKKGAVPISLAKNKNKLAQKDTDARWITKNNERHFGYKNHINADKKTKLINNYSVTNASTHDSVELENLVNETDNILYADSAYRSEHIETHLKEIKCTSEIHEKAYRNKPLSENQEKNITFPTDAKLAKKVIDTCRKIADKEDIPLRQSYSLTAPELLRQAYNRKSPRQKKKTIKATRRIRTIGRAMLRDLLRKMNDKQLKPHIDTLLNSASILF